MLLYLHRSLQESRLLGLQRQFEPYRFQFQEEYLQQRMLRLSSIKQVLDKPLYKIHSIKTAGSLPSLTFHSTIPPSVIVGDMAGMPKLLATSLYEVDENANKRL